MSVSRLIFLKSWIDENIEGRPLRDVKNISPSDLARQCEEAAVALGFALKDIHADVRGSLAVFLGSFIERKMAKKKARMQLQVAGLIECEGIMYRSARAGGKP